LGGDDQIRNTYNSGVAYPKIGGGMGGGGGVVKGKDDLGGEFGGKGVYMGAVGV